MTGFQASKSFSWVIQCRSLLLGILTFLAVAIPATTQTTTGRIIGTIADSQGAALVGATVTVASKATNVHWNAVTDSTGAYQVLDLPIGMYSVEVQIAGFNKTVTEPQELTINQSLRIDVHMKVGAVMEVIEVNSQSAQVETVNPPVGGTVTGAPIQNLPLNGREVLDLALTQPGVLPAPTTGYGSEKSGEFSGFRARICKTPRFWRVSLFWV